MNVRCKTSDIMRFLVRRYFLFNLKYNNNDKAAAGISNSKNHGLFKNVILKFDMASPFYKTHNIELID